MKENTFGATLRRLRKQKGLSVAKLALRLSISPSYIYDLEHDRRTPSVPMLKNLSAFFEVPFDFFLGEQKNAAVTTSGDNYGILLNHSENNGTITQGSVPPPEARGDFESVLRFRREHPDLFELCANTKYTEEELRAMVSSVIELRKKNDELNLTRRPR